MRTKYILIERGEEFKRTAVTLRVAQDIERRGLGIVGQPVTLKQVKEERIHIYREDDYFRHMAEHDLIEKYDGKRFKAVIHAFGVGWTEALAKIEGTDLPLLPIYACNISGKKTWYPETACVYYNDKQVVDVELKVYAGGAIFVCGLTPGILDEERWNRIKSKSLAFRCDEDGNAVTGLFK